MDYKFPPPLGNIFVKEVFEYYDMPILFSCENSTGQLYVVHCIEMSPSFIKWFFVAMSIERYKLLINDKITIRDSIVKAENDWVYEVTIPNENQKEVSIVYRMINNIQDNELPDDEVYLEFESDTDQLNPLPIKENATLVAERSMRDVLDIALQEKDSHTHEVNAELLGTLLIQTQNITYFLAAQDQLRPRGKLSKELKEKNKLNAVGLFASSFGIRLESQNHSNIFNETEMTNTLEKLMNLLSSTTNTDSFKGHIKNLNSRVIKTYLDLLVKLRQENYEIKTEWSSPSRINKKAYLTAEKISNAIDILREINKKEITNITLEGILLGISVANNTFQIKISDSEIISGKLHKGFKKFGYTILTDVKATVEEITEISGFEEEIKVFYTLLNLETI